MPRKVTTAPAAARAFDKARRWLTQPGSGATGAAKWEALKQARNTLRDYPCIGEKSEQPAHRQRAVSGYRLIYQVRPDTGSNETSGDVRVVALFGPGQP